MTVGAAIQERLQHRAPERAAPPGHDDVPALELVGHAHRVVCPCLCVWSPATISNRCPRADMAAKKKKILVLHNGRPSSGPEAEPLERDHMSTLAGALAGRGFDVSVVDAEDDTSRISQAVTVEQPDLIFNLVTHFRG